MIVAGIKMMQWRVCHTPFELLYHKPFASPSPFEQLVHPRVPRYQLPRRSMRKHGRRHG